LEWLDFEFYNYAWYWDEKNMDMTQEQWLIGHWLGIAHRIGSNMTYWVTKSGKVIEHSTVQHITTTDMAQPAIQDSVRVFDTAV
jgi:exo-beta-1,3-glucanase (GH17 family)